MEVSIAGNPLQGALLKGVEGMHRPGILDFRDTHLLCPLPTLPDGIGVKASFPLPCDMDTGLLEWEVCGGVSILSLIVVLALCVWLGRVPNPRRFVDPNLRKPVTYCVAWCFKLLGVVSTCKFVPQALAAVRALQEVRIPCKLLDSRSMFEPVLPALFTNSSGGRMPDPSLTGLRFAQYMDALIAAGVSATDPGSVADANEFRAWCNAIADCTALPEGGWWTCGPRGEVAKLRVFGAPQNLENAIFILVAVIVAKDLAKLCCLLHARWRGREVAPALRHFAASSLFVPLFWRGGGNALVRSLMLHEPTGCQLLFEVLCEALLHSMPLLGLNLYIYFCVLQTSVDAVTTATIPLSMISLLYLLLKVVRAFSRGPPGDATTSLGVPLLDSADDATTSLGVPLLDSADDAITSLGVPLLDRAAHA